MFSIDNYIYSMVMGEGTSVEIRLVLQVERDCCVFSRDNYSMVVGEGDYIVCSVEIVEPGKPVY